MKKIVSIVLALVTVCSMLVPVTVMAEEAKPSVVSSRKDSDTEDVQENAADAVYLGEAQPEPEYVNPLTGEGDYNPAAVGKRPVAVMINNHPRNFPQYNANLADVLFEVVVEHEYSRFMALFADYTNVPYLVSVRSYRYYFPMISSGFDAYYIHWGEDQTMMWYYEELGLDSYDGLSNSYLFGRDQGRLDNGYDLEHTSCFYGYLLPDQIASDGKRTDLKEEYLGNAFHFVPYGTTIVPQGDDCSFVDIYFGDEMSSQFTYDPINGVYLKYANGAPQVNGIDDEQFAFTNLVVLYTKIIDREDDPEADRKFLEVFGSVDDDYTNGFYLTQGKIIPIKWAKADEWDRLRFYDLNGSEIELNRGKTYISYSYDDSAEFSTYIPDGYLQ